MNLLRHLLISVVTLSLLVLVSVGCQSNESLPPTPTITATTNGTAVGPNGTTVGPTSEIAFTLRHDGQPDIEISDFVGLLNGRNGCIHIDIPDSTDLNTPPASYLAILPPDYTLIRHEGNIVLIDGQERAVGSIGEFIWVAGATSEEIPAELEEQLPRYCSGPYIYIIGAAGEIPF